MAITPPAPDEPFARSAVSEAAAVRPRPPGPRRERWPVPLLVVLTVAGVVLGFSNMEVPEELRAGGAGTSPPAPAAQPTPAPLGDGGSFMQAGNLRAALDAAREAAGGPERILRLRVSAENVQTDWLAAAEPVATIVRQGREIDVRPAGATGASLPFARVPADAPQRIARRVAALAGVQPEDISYVLLDAERPGWTAYITSDAAMRSGAITYYFAALDGSRVRSGEDR